MLRIHSSKSATAGSYYTSEAAAPAVWFGRAAADMGLAGEAGSKAFGRLLDNRHPLTEVKLTPRDRAGRIVLTDFNFNPPKSYALAVSLTADRDRLIAAGQEAAVYAMSLAERDAAVRVRKGGRYEDRVTGNWAGALHTHECTRPVDGRTDPGLHFHATVGNVSWDAQEAGYKALKVRPAWESARDIEAAFHDRLRQNLHALGYKTRDTKDRWEIRGVPQTAIRKFSQRTTLIEKAAGLAGKLTKKQKAALGARTREPKRPGLDPVTTREKWRARLTAAERGKLDSLLAPQRPAWQERMTRLRQAVWFKARQQDKQPQREVDYVHS